MNLDKMNKIFDTVLENIENGDSLDLEKVAKAIKLGKLYQELYKLEKVPQWKLHHHNRKSLQQTIESIKNQISKIEPGGQT